ncbi:hypothetical protein F5X98DRAFT_320824 [Xylaria grammica]|nr:hypothetical protein F5X98DRAFT_320824 [Xylaria grammica]
MGKDASGELIKDLKKSHDNIRRRIQEFSRIANSNSIRMPMWFFYETKNTRIAKKILGARAPNIFLPGSIQNSACIPGFERRGLERTHGMMNKFEECQCPDYIQVREAIQSILENASSTLKSRSQSIPQTPIEPDMHKKQRARLLASLKFTGLNEWKNHPHEGTFPWIFHASGNPSEYYWASLDGDTRHTPLEALGNRFANFEGRPWRSFEHWLRSKDDNTYWIKGKLGSGKTTLVKYLIESPLTTAALSIWAKDPVIISHFFWKAGPVKLQKNFKGCLCSILYQALEPDTVPLGTILTTDKSLLTKTSDTDWSQKELRGLCLDVLGNYPSPVCIFLDGLDEICIEDRSGLLELVGKLRAIPNTKICLTSRPEPRLESALSNYPQLRLQDLTFWDMEKYASETIQPHISNGRISSSVGSDITNRLTRKADGVFLWLRLALQDLIRGLQYIDSDRELYARIEQMPDDLNKLYADIWTRINEDSLIYRKDAALYFKLAIASRNKIQSELKLLHLMATTNDSVQRSLVNTMNAADLEGECKITIQKIQQRCIGLLEIVPSSAPSYKTTWDPQYAPLLPYWRMAVQFPHRTAYDFFTKSDDGNSILEYDSSASHDLSLLLLKGNLIMTKLIRFPLDCPGVDNALDTLARLTDTISMEDINKVLKDLRYLYDNGFYYPTGIQKPHFLAVAARLPFREFVLSDIESSPNPPLLATDVLRFKSNPSLSYFGDSEIPDFPDVLSGFWEPLLKLEADPSIKGICYPPEIRSGRGPEMPFRSPTGNFLFEIFKRDSERIYERVRQLQRFIEAKPNLQERIPFLIEDTHNGLYIGADFGERSFYPGDYSGPIVVLDLNLEFLVEAYFKRALKRGITASPDGVPYRPTGDTSSDTSIRLALIGFMNSRASGMDHYQCSNNTATKQLLNLLVQFLYGDKSSDLAEKVRHELKKIKDDIKGGSSEYTEVKQKRLFIFLAEKNLGYRFVNEAGVVDLDRAEADS